MYQITDEVIKKVIPFINLSGDMTSSDPNLHWYSWTEFVAQGPQPATVMVSHWWGGRFRDFMAVIDQLVMDKALSVSTRIWVCTFANNQFGENFGRYLCDGPFMKAMEVAEITVVIVDRDAGSLQRSWCGLELHYSLEHGKDLHLYTSSGRIGAQGTCSGPLVEAVKDWDIRRCEAAEAGHRRQILNYVAGVDEHSGLKVDSQGAPVLENGRPAMMDHARDPDQSLRINDEQEYAHESNLFKRHGKRFEDLNMMVRLEVLAKVGREKRPQGCEVEAGGLRGVTVGQIRTLVKKVQMACGEWTPPRKWQDLTCHDVVKKFVRPITESRRCSYMELVADRPQQTQYFIQHSWKSKFQDTVRAIEWFAEAMHLADSAVCFWDILSINQHNAAAEVGFSQHDDVPGKKYYKPLYESEGLLMCLGGRWLNRGWVLVTIELCIRLGKSLYLGCCSGVLACSRPFPYEGWLFGNVDPDIFRSLQGVDVENCEVSREEDRQTILTFFSQGLEEKMARTVYTRAKNRFTCWAAGPILRTAAARDDYHEIQDVSTCPGLWLNSDSLKGSLGETALHVAAGAGALNAVQELLRSRMDPNIEDGIRERPLHYAALSGHAQVASLLLAAEADPWAESSFGETPLQVAEQNPAGFLKVNTNDITAVLKAAMEAKPIATPLTMQSTPFIYSFVEGAAQTFGGKRFKVTLCGQFEFQKSSCMTGV